MIAVKCASVICERSNTMLYIDVNSGSSAGKRLQHLKIAVKN